MVGRFDEQLSDFLEEEADNNEKQESDVYVPFIFATHVM